MTYCEAYYLKNLQSLLTGNDTFRKLLLSPKHTQLVHGLLLTLGNKMEDMLRRRNNTPRTVVMSPSQLFAMSVVGRSSSADLPQVSGVHGEVPSSKLSPGMIPRSPAVHATESFSSTKHPLLSSPVGPNMPRLPGTPPNHMLNPGQLPKKPDIPPPEIPHSVQNYPPVVPPPR